MRQIIFLLSAAAFIIVAIMRITDPVLPIIAADFELTVGKASLIVTAFALPYGLIQLVLGPLGDRFGKLTIIVISLGASSFFTVACATASSIEALAALRFMAGIATAAVVPLSMAFIADHFAYEVRQPVIARYLSGLILGQIVGGSLGGIMAALFGWRVIFVVFGVLVGAMTYFVWRYSNHHRETLRRAPLRGRHLFIPYIVLLRQSGPRQLIITATIEGFFFFAGGAFIGAFLHEQFGLGYAWVGLLLACFGLGSLAYTYTAKFIVPALGERRMIIVGSLTMASCYLGFAFAPGWQVCIPIMIICGFGFYLMHNTLQTLATELAPDARGTAVALFVFSLMIGQGTGVAFFGPIIDQFGYRAAFELIAVALACLGIWFQGKLKRTAAAAVTL
jgi:predicted MFS family arabinose efflux permease